MKHYCPEDIIELVPEKRKFGKFSKWLVCPKCGFRKYNGTKEEECAEFGHYAILELNDNGGRRSEPEY